MATYTIDDPNKMPPKGFKKILKRWEIYFTIDTNQNYQERKC